MMLSTLGLLAKGLEVGVWLWVVIIVLAILFIIWFIRHL